MEYQLISADSHVNPHPTFWRDYLPKEFRDQAPRFLSTEEGDFVEFEGKRNQILGINATAGKEREDVGWAVRRLTENRAGGWDPDERLKDQDIDGVQAEAIYGGGPLRSEDPRLTRASFSAYNDWLADFCSTNPKRLIGMAYIPVQDLDDAIAETRRAIGKGLRGAVIPAAPELTPTLTINPDDVATSIQGTSQKSWDDPSWDDFWSTLEELGVPAAIHTGGRQPRMDHGAHYVTDVLRSKLRQAKPLRRAVSRWRARPPSRAASRLRRGVPRLDSLLPVLHGLRLYQAPRLARLRARRASELLFPPAGIGHVHRRPGRPAGV